MGKAESPSQSREPPQVFVSYAHEAEEHNRWVKKLATDLRAAGIDALLDIWRVRLGGDFTVFMDSMRACDRVLLICTPTYARKANEGAGGVGYERQIITAELAETITKTTFVPVLRVGDPGEAIPTFARTRRYIDMRDASAYSHQLEELLRDLHGVLDEPMLGSPALAASASVAAGPVEPEPPLGPNPFAVKEPPAVLAPAGRKVPAKPACTPPPSSFREGVGADADVTLDLGGGVSLEMVLIPPGEFMMGSPASEQDHIPWEGPQHRVRIASPFYLGKYPVTQAQSRAVIGDDPSLFKGDDRPVERVSWERCRKFCDRLSRRAARQVRLPSEAEWEYACRAGTTTPFYFGATISTDQANYDGRSVYGSSRKGVYRKETTPVGSFPANAFGLFDMHGNVWEWCEDTWHEGYTGAPDDGSAWVAGGDASRRVIRGGSWALDEVALRSAFRLGSWLDYRVDSLGFRLASGI